MKLIPALSSFLAVLLIVFSVPLPTGAEEQEQPVTLVEKVEMLDPQDPEDAKLIKQYIPEEIPEGFKVKRVLKLHYLIDQERNVEYLHLMVPIDEKGREHGTAVAYPGGWGGTHRVFHFKEGVKHGVEKIYHRSDKGFYVIEEIPWENGEIHGEKKTYHPDGTIRMLSTFNRGAPQGERKTYSPEGKLLEVVGYKDGQMHGDRIQYWSGTDTPRRVVPYNMGAVDGVVRDYHQNGKLRREIPYRDAKLHGIERKYDEEGKLIRERYWLNDEAVARGQFEQEFEEK